MLEGCIKAEINLFWNRKNEKDARQTVNWSSLFSHSKKNWPSWSVKNRLRWNLRWNEFGKTIFLWIFIPKTTLQSFFYSSLKEIFLILLLRKKLFARIRFDLWTRYKLVPRFGSYRFMRQFLHRETYIVCGTLVIIQQCCISCTHCESIHQRMN